MALLPGGNEGAFNGTTDVVLAAAPGASVQRVVNSCGGHNKDTSPVTITLFKKKGASTYTIGKVTVPNGQNYTLVGPGGLHHTVVLDATDETLEGDLGGAPAATNPDFQTSFLDKS